MELIRALHVHCETASECLPVCSSGGMLERREADRPVLPSVQEPRGLADYHENVMEDMRVIRSPWGRGCNEGTRQGYRATASLKHRLLSLASVTMQRLLGYTLGCLL